MARTLRLASQGRVFSQHFPYRPGQIRKLALNNLFTPVVENVERRWIADQPMLRREPYAQGLRLAKRRTKVLLTYQQAIRNAFRVSTLLVAYQKGRGISRAAGPLTVAAQDTNRLSKILRHGGASYLRCS